jgi:hypothetical protein
MKNNTRVRTRLILALWIGCCSLPVFADIGDLNVDDAFAYKTQKTATVDIQVNTPTRNLTGLSFYSAGVDGLRLLDTRTVDRSGHYVGKLVIPAYLKSIVVKSRWLDNFKAVTLPISSQKITAVIDHL